MPTGDDSFYNATVGLLDRNLARGADRPYLVTHDRTFTYGEICERSATFAAGLLELGLSRGDRVLISSVDSAEFVCTFWGAIRAGLVAVPISTALTAADLRFVVEDSRAAALVFGGSTARTVKDADLERIVRIGVVESPASDARSWSAVSADPRALDGVRTRDTDVALWLYTSGTTGTPKAAMHTHASLRAVPDAQARQVLGIGPDDLILSVSRMFFTYGLGTSVYVPAALGASVVVNAMPAVPGSVQALIDRHSPTLLYGVASFFAGYVDLPAASVGPRMRAAISAGELLRPSVLKKFTERFQIPLLDCLGSTEALNQVTSNRFDDIVPASVGRPLDGFEAQIRDPDGNVLAEGERGELWLRGPTLFVGYWNRPERTARTLVDGWLRTGDVARIVDGRVFHEGRFDDLLKLGGIWVAPSEIEDILLAHPDVTEAVVVVLDTGSGVPTLKAFIRSDRRDAALSKELTRACSGLASFKVPRAFEIVDELPRTATGKLKRYELRERAASGA
jgi:benzoate-CoA ligase